VKRPAAALSPTAKGKQVRLDVRPPLASVTPRKASARSRPAAGTDDDWVAYCAMLDSIPSVESCSSSSDETSGSELIFASPPPILNIRIDVRLLPVRELLEAGMAEQETSIETEAHVVAPEGLLSCFSCLMLLLIVMDLTFGYIGVCDDDDARADFHQVVQGEPSSRLGDDDDEQIVQCLQHVRILDLL
jgi:hypothetical protein